jgi:LPS O-antigen subunit length determinant protein (WzzB/FepE family)
LENSKANKLIDKILVNLDKTGINTDSLIEDIKELRTYALEQQVPLVVKVLRLTYEHIASTESFLIPLLGDDAIETEVEEGEEAPVQVEVSQEVSPVESLKYVIALTRNLENKSNISDLKEYRDLLNAY